MKIKNTQALYLIFSVALTLQGCAVAKYGWTLNEAQGQYLLVDESAKSFGYKRMNYAMVYFSTLKGFVKENGFPSFIYEDETAEGREII